MRKEGIEVRLDGEMEDLFEMLMVYMGEDPKEVFVNVLGGICE